MTGATVPVAAPVPATPTGGQGPPGEPPGDFGPVLEAEAQRAAAAGDGSSPESARTAHAEGAAAEGDAPEAVKKTPTGAVAATAAADVTALEPVSQPVAAAGPAPVPAPAAAAGEPATPSAPPSTLPIAAVPAQPVASVAPAAEPATAPAAQAVPAPSQAEAAPAEPPSGGDPSGEPRAATAALVPGRTAARPADIAPAETALSRPAPSAQPLRPEQADGRQAPPAVDGGVAAPDADAAASASPQAPPPGSRGDRSGPAAQQTPAAAAPVEAQPSSHPPRTAAAPVVRHAVTLHELVDAARTVIRVAARDGRAQARITLHPAELGSVEIRLRYHANGVSADVLADSAQAAQALGQAVPELRRALEAQGLSVLWLDVRHGGGDEPRPHHEQAGRTGRGGATAVTEDETTIEPARLPRPGSTVDVLA